MEIEINLLNRANRAQLLLMIGTSIFAAGAMGFIAGYLSQGQTSVLGAAIPVMVVKAYKRRFDISFLRKHFIILCAYTLQIIRKINYERRYYLRRL